MPRVKCSGSSKKTICESITTLILIYLNLQDWLERHGWKIEAAAIPAVLPPKIRPLDPAVPECRLCEEFPTFSKPFEFHKHLAEIHFRMELNNELPQNNVSYISFFFFKNHNLGRYRGTYLPSLGCWEYSTVGNVHLIISSNGISRYTYPLHWNKVPAGRYLGPYLIIWNNGTVPYLFSSFYY